MLGVEMNKGDGISWIRQLPALLCVKQKTRIKCRNIWTWDERGEVKTQEGPLTYVLSRFLVLARLACDLFTGGSKPAHQKAVHRDSWYFIFYCDVVTYKLVRSSVWALYSPQCYSHLVYQATAWWEVLCWCRTSV